MSDWYRVAAPLLAFALPLCAQAGDSALREVVVTATREERPIDRTLADVSTIDSEAIARAGASSLTELLRTFAAVEISQNGGAGATSGVFVRGTKTSQTLVLVDGVRLENPTSGTANLEFLSLSSIDRIEIVRGPLSSLYGSGAIGGVIQIFTRQGGGPTTPSLSVGVGSQGTASVQAGLTGSAGAAGATRYSIAVAGERTGGYDATLPTSPNHQADRDGNRVRSVHAALRQTLPSGWELGASLLSNDGRVDYDDAFSTPETAVMHYRSSTVSGFARGTPLRGWQTELNLGQSRIQYSFEAFTFAPRADTSSLFWQNRVALPAGKLHFGIEDIRQQLSGEGVTTGAYAYLNDSRRTDSIFAGYEIGLGRHLLRAQLRRDSIQSVGVEPTGTLAWGYVLSPRWLVRASVASAFRAPTFDDLYNPFGSNPDLQPERSRGAEVGAEYRNASTLFKVTAFASRIEDAIELDASYTPRNIATARVDGVTFEGRRDLHAWTLRGSVTLQDPRGERLDAATGETVGGQLARRARQLGYFGLDWRVAGATLGLEWQLEGRRVESDGSPIAGYGVVNLNGTYPLAERWELFARLANIGDKLYETANGYAMPPRSLYVGLRYRPRAL